MQIFPLRRSPMVVGAILLTAHILFGVFLSSVVAQSPAAPPPSARLARLGPGVLTIIPPRPENGEAFSGPRELIEITARIPNLDWTPNYTPKAETLLEMARTVTIRRNKVWNLEFAFKPLRMVWVDVPQPNGVMERKLIWYMVYRLTNRGRHLSSVKKEPEGVFETGYVDHSQRFFGSFVLHSPEFGKSYLDRVIPSAMPLIKRRQDARIQLLDSVQISRVAIPVSRGPIDTSVWGVVTWENVDPRIDFLSVYIQGLTNAYQWTDPDDYQGTDPPGAGRKITRKTLQLNFWRPGDSVKEHEEEIRYGIPAEGETDLARLLKIYDVPERVDYRWIYR